MFGSSPDSGVVRFPLFGIPVSIDWSFLLVPVMASSLGWQQAAVWTAVIFFSVLLHELGHAIAMQVFGFAPRISLYALGGLTFWPERARPTPKQDLIVSGAGPAVSISLGVVSLVGLVLSGDPLWKSVFTQSVWVNLIWGAVNLLPLMPLDGSHMLDASAELLGKVRQPWWVGAVSLAVGAVAVVLAVATKMIILGFVGMTAILRGWQRVKTRDEAQFMQRLEAFYAAAWSDTPKSAEPLLAELRALVKTDEDRRTIANAEAWLMIRLGQPEDADRVLRSVPKEFQYPELRARVAAHRDDAAGVFDALLPELESGQLSVTAAPLLASALEREERFDDAERVALLMLTGASSRADAEGLVMVTIMARLFEARAIEQCQRICDAAWKKFGAGEDAFNLACCFVQRGQLDEAMNWLRECVKAGMAQLDESLANDPDIAPLRERPDFAELKPRSA